MGYYEFPHTRNYDSDLGFLIRRYKELSGDYNTLVQIYQIVKNNIMDITLDQLQKWLDDGTLEVIIQKLLLLVNKFFMNESSIDWDNLVENDTFTIGYHKNQGDLPNTLYLVKKTKTLECDLSNNTKTLYATPLSHLNHIVTWGADNSGTVTFDFTNIINYIDSYGTLIFDEGTYSCLPFNSNDKEFNIHGNNSKLVFKECATHNEVNYVFKLGNEKSDKPLDKRTDIYDLEIQAPNLITYGLWLVGYSTHTHNIKVVCNNGIILGTYEQKSVGFSSDHWLENTTVHGRGSQYGDGITIVTHDNTVNYAKVIAFKHSFSLKGDGTRLYNIHDLYYTGQAYDEDTYKKSVSVYVSEYLNVQLINYYSDSFYKFIYAPNGGNVTLDTCYYYNYLSQYNCGCMIHDLHDTNFFESVNTTYYIPKGVSIGINANSVSRTYDTYHFKLSNNVIFDGQNLGEDLLGGFQKEYYPYDYRTRVSNIELNKWYYVGCLFGTGKNSIMGVMILEICYINKIIKFSINLREGSPDWFDVIDKINITENFKIGIKYTYGGKGYGSLGFYLMQTSGSGGPNDFSLKIVNGNYYLGGRNGTDCMTEIVTIDSVDDEIVVNP